MTEEIEDVVFDVILLQVVHQVGTVALTFKTTTKKKSTEKTVIKRDGGVASRWIKNG